jgi:hypothetical protein
MRNAEHHPPRSCPSTLPQASRRDARPGRAAWRVVANFKAVGERDEQALCEAHGAAEGAEGPGRIVLDDFVGVAMRSSVRP